MGFVVTGISQNGDIKSLELALKDVGLPLDPVQLLSREDSTEGVARHPATPHIMTRDHAGGYVPGINDTRSGAEFFRTESLGKRLSNLGIPDSEVANYMKAWIRDVLLSLTTQGRRPSLPSRRSSGTWAS